jgi:hypothetical protein
MSDTNIYFGSPGSLGILPHPRGGVRTSRVRPTQEFVLGNGEMRARRSREGSRLYELDWESLTFDTHSTILKYDQGHMGPGPFVLLDPGQRNTLTVNQAAATSLTNDTSNFTIAGSAQTIASSTTLTSGTPRSLAWTFNVTSPASAASILTLDSPYAGWPGVPVVASRSLCFSCLVRGGGSDAIVTYAPEMLWYDVSSALISTSTGSSVASSSGAWTALSVVATAPATAAYVLPRVHYVSGASSGSIGYLTQFQLEEGSTVGTWRPGTGVYPVTIVGYDDEWPWLYADEVRRQPKLVLRQDGR